MRTEIELSAIKKISEYLICDAFLDLTSREKNIRDKALNFLTSPNVKPWADMINREPETIARQAEYFYKHPEELPLEFGQGRGRKAKFSK